MSSTKKAPSAKPAPTSKGPEKKVKAKKVEPGGAPKAKAKPVKAPKAAKPVKVDGGKALSAAEIAALRALPSEYEAAPTGKLLDAVQNARNAEKAFDEYGTKLVKGSDLGADAGRRVAAARKTFERAERAWSRARSNVPSVVAARTEAEELKSALLGALRYFLRADAEVQARCDAVVEGSGDVDLADDLETLSELFVENGAKLRKADVPKGAVTRARELGATLTGGAAKRKVNPEQADAQALRNRAYHAMEAAVDAIHDAGRYVFRDEPKHKKAFRRIERPARRRPI